ncbi:dUTP diphosphatase (plasmid) [Flagellatimonas centrodinii]|uniref:dUTP diphosphatase n=1 Tax=Flagellatimonas centrodinii TaxID=2806210 RepID=UPI001FEE3A46|nr:dUTP diphosphatase [Flagellatimonas centrodinii]ULQ48361.1 dUTP diphosphatase [Flagellatimonas centrodinii]
MNAISAVEVTRDASGMWMHPGFPWGVVGSANTLQETIEAMGLEMSCVLMEEDARMPLAQLYATKLDVSLCSQWAPSRPWGDGWFLVSIHDSEDGPCATWVREVSGRRISPEGRADVEAHLMAELGSMLDLQMTMNEVVNPSWLSAGYPFLRAVLIEGAEGIEHVGWKWWKAQTPDDAQARLEVIDKLHFYLSHFIVAGAAQLGVDRYPDRAARQQIIEAAREIMVTSLRHELESCVLDFDGMRFAYENLSVCERFELMAGLAVARRASLRLLIETWVQLGGEGKDLVREYIGKNTLNVFRARNGYKEGRYVKEWDGREDNVHLVELLPGIPTEGMYAALWSALEQRYQQLAGPA